MSDPPLPPGATGRTPAGTVLVTGGTGKLGRVLVGGLVDRGHDVRLLSRRTPPAGHRGARWCTGNLRTGAGLGPALTGVRTVVHCATSARGDLAVTRRLVDQMRAAGASRLVYVSIVGVDRIPMSYYRAKVRTERLVATSGLDWAVLRATQFHDLVAAVIAAQRFSPVVFVPAGLRCQPVDVRDVAARLIELVERGSTGRVADFGGPQVRAGDDLARAWLRAHGSRRRVRRLRLPGRIGKSLAAGANLVPAHADGVITFEEFLALN